MNELDSWRTWTKQVGSGSFAHVSSFCTFQKITPEGHLFGITDVMGREGLWADVTLKGSKLNSEWSDFFLAVVI